MRRLAIAVLVAVGGFGGCGHGAGPAAPSTSAERALDAAIDGFYDPHLAFRPALAIDLGYHAYDGQVPDRSAAAIASEIDRLHHARTTFEAIGGLPPRREVERQVVLAEIRKELFDLETRRRPERDPTWYLRGFSLQAYVARDYAPLATRGAALLAACRAAPAYYATIEANLEPSLPRALLTGATIFTQGTLDFVQHDAHDAFAALPDEALRGQIDDCLDQLAKTLGDFGGWLGERMKSATDDFAIGGDLMITMLRETELIDTDLATLERLAAADLERNRAAIVEAARAIDPSKPAAEVIAMVSADKASQDDLLAEAGSDLDQLRAFIRVHAIVTVPRDDTAEVRPSPPALRRLNFAALGGSGPFEPTAQPSFFYVSLPDPSWPPAQQQAYLPAHADLLFTAAHEVWPGHFLMHLHERARGSKVLESFQTYTTSEGWAHYVEEMMWDQGLGDGAPRAHIGELKSALLRDVRFEVALGLHTHGMTIAEAQQLFVDQAFADPGNAKQQALRGTLDPMFLGYTLGKLAIRKLRDDWMARHPGATLQQFHDEFLSWAEAPLPVIRTLMLGPDAGPVL